MFNIVLFGPPGSGKGTQSAKLIQKFGFTHLSTGDLLRAEIAAQTELGLKAKSLMDAGNLVPDEVVIGMIASRLESNKDGKGFIFDGFPRTVAQAEALDKLMEKYNTSIAMMIALEVPHDELVKRLLLRGEESGRADDMNQDIIENRIKEYNNKTVPVANYYRHQDKYKGIDGVGTVEEIFQKINTHIESMQQS